MCWVAESRKCWAVEVYIRFYHYTVYGEKYCLRAKEAPRDLEFV